MLMRISYQPIRQLKPYTGNEAPCMARADGEARNNITSDKALGDTQRLKSDVGIASRFSGVSIVPGSMQFTLILLALSSADMLSVRRITALFDTL